MLIRIDKTKNLSITAPQNKWKSNFLNLKTPRPNAYDRPGNRFINRSLRSSLYNRLWKVNDVDFLDFGWSVQVCQGRRNSFIYVSIHISAEIIHSERKLKKLLLETRSFYKRYLDQTAEKEERASETLRTTTIATTRSNKLTDYIISS